MANITKHANKRLKNRLNVTNKYQDKYVTEAISKGLSEPECKGNLKRYLSKQRIKHPEAYSRVYNNYVYFFSRDYHKLITCYPLPGNLTKLYQELQRKKLCKK